MKNAIKDKSDYEHKVEHFEAKNGDQIAYNSVLETDLEVLRLTNDSLLDVIENLELKDTEYITVFDTHTEFDTIPIPVEIPCDNAFNEPFEEGDSTFTIAGNVTNSGITINKLSFPNRTTVVMGEKKMGLFKRESIVTVQNSNPHIKVTGITSYTFPDNRKWYQKGWPKFVIGGVAGAGLAYLILK